MKLSTLLFAGILVLNSSNLYSQHFEVPKDYTLKVAADYKMYEKDMIEAAKWLVKTPLDEQENKRAKVSAFVISWVNGSPTVDVELNEFIMDFDKKNKGMLVIFMASCAKYVLENDYSKDMRAKHRAALRDMMTVYNSGNGIKKDKKMEKLIKSDADGKLDEWLEYNLKINKN
jgi:hypothetical protein